MLTLDLNALAVDSFDTAAGAPSLSPAAHESGDIYFCGDVDDLSPTPPCCCASS